VHVRDGDNRRGAQRGAAAIDTRFRMPSAAARSPCRIIDISSSGARLRLYQQLAPETSIRLSLPGKGLVDAHIIWADGREAGCRFDRPLDEATVSVLQASATERRTGAAGDLSTFAVLGGESLLSRLLSILAGRPARDTGLLPA
jgi:hypothetical protein